MALNLTQLRSDLKNVVLSRTGRRVRNLDIDLQPERVVLHGLATSYHVKQLAQEGVREFLPHVTLANEIVVGS